MNANTNWAERVRFFGTQVAYAHHTSAQELYRDVRYAESLAAAELLAEQVGAEFAWSDDWHVTDHAREFCDEAYPYRNPETCERVILTLGGTPLTALGCIDDATDVYRRLIQAELAHEALPELIAARDAVSVDLLAGVQ